MAQKDDPEALGQAPISTPEMRPPEVVDEGRKKRLANLTQKGRPKGTTRKVKDLTNSETKKVISQMVAGVPIPVVAASVGISEGAVKQIREQFRDVFNTLGEVENYRKVKSDLFDAVELKALKSLMDQDKHDRATLNQVAYSLSVLHNAGRLEKNLSTANINTSSYLRFELTEKVEGNE